MTRSHGHGWPGGSLRYVPCSTGTSKSKNNHQDMREGRGSIMIETMKPKKPRYHAFYGWESLKCVTGTKREIINRLKRTNILSFNDTLVITPEDDNAIELFRADTMVGSGDFLSWSEIDEIYGTHFTAQASEDS